MKITFKSQKDADIEYRIELQKDLLEIKANSDFLENSIEKIKIKGTFDLPELEVLELAKEYILKLESKKCSFDFIKSAFKHINHYSINYVSDLSQRFVDFLGEITKNVINDFNSEIEHNNIETINVSIDNDISIDFKEISNFQSVKIKFYDNYIYLNNGKIEVKVDNSGLILNDMTMQLAEIKNELFYRNKNIISSFRFLF